MKKAESEILRRALSRDAWSSFPTASGAETWELTFPGEAPRQVTLSKGNLRVFKAIQEAPLYCASRVRISDRVLILKRDYGVNITTRMFKSENKSECDRFGIYTLADRARRVDDIKVAA